MSCVWCVPAACKARRLAPRARNQALRNRSSAPRVARLRRIPPSPPPSVHMSKPDKKRFPVREAAMRCLRALVDMIGVALCCAISICSTLETYLTPGVGETQQTSTTPHKPIVSDLYACVHTHAYMYTCCAYAIISACARIHTCSSSRQVGGGARPKSAGVDCNPQVVAPQRVRPDR